MAITRPVNLQKPFADTWSKNTIPVPSQIGITNGAASYTDGFPPLTMTPIAAGGVPPAGADFNGILNILSQHTLFQNAGGRYRFDAALATAIGGYPVGFVLQNDTGLNSYVNILAANTTNFNSTPASIGVSWVPYAGQTATTGRLLNIQTFTSSGTYTPVAGAKNVRVRCLGGGGAGGGAAGTGASQAASGGGGASSGYAESWIINPGVQTVTVGAGGTGAVGAAGNGGGTSSFGALVVVSGGGGGALGNAVSALPSFGPGGGNPGQVWAGGNVISSFGTEGGYATLISALSVAGAVGASSPFGGGGLHTANATGNAAAGKGAGGSSASAYASQGALAGGAGLVIVEEYA